MQKIGSESFAKIISVEANENVDTVSLDLTQAYCAPHLEELTRTIHYQRPTKDDLGSITIEDRVQFAQPEAFSTALVTRGNFKMIDSNIIRVSQHGISLDIHIDTRGEVFSVVENPIFGFLEPNKPKAQRIGIYLESPNKESSITLKISPTNLASL